MASNLMLNNTSFHSFGPVGIVPSWDIPGVGTVLPCHPPDFIVIDDHTAHNNQGRRGASALSTVGPIDTRSLVFDDGNMRTFGIDGACVDMDVVIDLGQQLDFSWKFITRDGGSSGANDFAMILAYAGGAPRPAPAPALADMLAGPPPSIDLMRDQAGQPAINIHDPAMPPRLAEGRDLRTNSASNLMWMRGAAWRPAGGFQGTVRWIVSNGWRLRKGLNPATDNENSLLSQRAFPASLLLDCVEIL